MKTTIVSVPPYYRCGTLRSESDAPVSVIFKRVHFVLNTYVPQGKALDHPDYEVKKRFLDRVRAIVEREAARPFVWVGDLNVSLDRRASCRERV